METKETEFRKLKTIKFTYNWNHKLNNKAFTTIRLTQNKKFEINEKVVIKLNDEIRTIAVIQAIKTFKLCQLSIFMAYLDTGYNLEESKKVFYKMYPKVNFEEQTLDVILLVNEYRISFKYDPCGIDCKEVIELSDWKSKKEMA